MNLLKLFRSQKETEIGQKKVEIEVSHPKNPDILHLWEDDYLMIELLPSDNLDFVINETRRINNFAEEHFDGAGFTDITPVGKKPFKTIEKLINISEVEIKMKQAGLEIVQKIHIQGADLYKGDKTLLGFGTNTFAIICNKQERLLKDIWITGYTNTEEDKQKLISALLLFGKEYNFIGVNWFKCEYYNLIERNRVEEFVESCC